MDVLKKLKEVVSNTKKIRKIDTQAIERAKHYIASVKRKAKTAAK